MENPIRRCKDCGAVLPEGAGSNGRYCDACRKLKRKEANHSYNMRHKGKRRENPPVVRYCSVCGKALPAGSAANRKYCLFAARRCIWKKQENVPGGLGQLSRRSKNLRRRQSLHRRRGFLPEGTAK